MAITPSSYHNKVKAYFLTIGLAPTAVQLEELSEALYVNNGSV